MLGTEVQTQLPSARSSCRPHGHHAGLAQATWGCGVLESASAGGRWRSGARGRADTVPSGTVMARPMAVAWSQRSMLGELSVLRT